MIEFVAPRPKIYSYIMDDDSSKKKAKGTKGKKCIIEFNKQPARDWQNIFIYL